MANQYTVEVFISDTEKECRKCGKVKPHSSFHKDSKNKHARGLAYYCKECACSNSRKNHKRRKEESDEVYKLSKINSYLKRTYGITVEDKRKILSDQRFMCAICGTILQEFGTHTHIDHCHKTGKIREILCTNCNRGIGHFQESSQLLLTASNYLLKHNLLEKECNE